MVKLGTRVDGGIPVGLAGGYGGRGNDLQLRQLDSSPTS